MDKSEQPLWSRLLWIFIWLLLLANVIYDYSRAQRLTLYSILMFFALLLGSKLISRLMTTNAYQFYDTLLPHVQSVTVVHPPLVALVTNVQCQNGQKSRFDPGPAACSWVANGCLDSAASCARPALTGRAPR